MSTTIERGLSCLAALALAASCASPGSADRSPAAAAPSGPFGFGSTPSQAELARFVSPLADGRGLPPGSGSVAQGKVLYAQQCGMCHGAQLQGGLGDRLIGGRGTLVNADPKKAPIKTVESYWPYATTLFDYIYRSMPLNAPASLSYDQVYALCAYILAEAKIVPEDAVIGADNLAKVVMPNRDGFIPDHRPEKFPAPGETPHQDLKLGQTPR